MLPSHTWEHGFFLPRDEFIAENVFWVPVEARWTTIRGKAPTISQKA